MSGSARCACSVCASQGSIACGRRPSSERARPRRELLLEGAASLNPSERRIAQLSATNLSNREIARQLFVTPKTIEYHLRNA